MTNVEIRMTNERPITKRVKSSKGAKRAKGAREFGAWFGPKDGHSIPSGLVPYTSPHRQRVDSV